MKGLFVITALATCASILSPVVASPLEPTHRMIARRSACKDPKVHKGSHHTTTSSHHAAHPTTTRKSSGGGDPSSKSSKSTKGSGGSDGGDDDPSDDDSSSGGGSKWSGFQVTTYGGSEDNSDQLANPACFNGNWQPDASEVYGVAISDSWSIGSKPKCGDYLKFTHGSKSVIGRVIDACAGGCPDNNADLTPNVFKALGAISVGVIKDMSATIVDASDVEWSEAKYGPKTCDGSL